MVMCIFALTLISISYHIYIRRRQGDALRVVMCFTNALAFRFGVCWPHVLSSQCCVSSLNCTHLLLISLKWVSNSQNFANNLGDFMVFFWSSCF